VYVSASWSAFSCTSCSFDTNRATLGAGGGIYLAAVSSGTTLRCAPGRIMSGEDMTRPRPSLNTHIQTEMIGYDCV
jgi:hypothetical protein